jgi:threonine dehydrogenase-like Zn-dependent dehydrogenase
MTALVYEAPYQMNIRTVEAPTPGADEVLIRVAFSGICGSELSGFEGKNALRKPPLIMGHEFSGVIAAIGAAANRPDLAVGLSVTVNPIISCMRCAECLNGRQQLCGQRKLLSASLPGSNAQFVTARADAVHALPTGISLETAALTEPAACAVHAVEIAMPRPYDSALVVGAGPIGLFTLQALRNAGVKTLYCADLNAERLAMAEALGAAPVTLNDDWRGRVDIAVDAVGAAAARRACITAVRSAGRVVWLGLHEAESPLPVNDLVRREIVCLGSFAYSHRDFRNALDDLAHGRLGLEDRWTRVEPLERGTPCFEELLHGSAVAKIWLQPPAH